MNLLLPILVAVSLGLLLWQWWEACRFPLHRRRQVTGRAPSLTVLKPIKGRDAETEGCLRSWLSQAYPGDVQWLFLVASEDDAAAALVRQLLAEHPNRDAELMICPERWGPNSKVSKLAQAESRAKYGVLVVSDADVHVPPGFLAELVAPLEDEAVVLVNPFYQLATPATPAMHWEALAVNADFWSSVLQARRLSELRFALGAVMAVRRTALEGIGGYAALVNHLADDFELGRRLVSPTHDPAPVGRGAVEPLRPSPRADSTESRPSIELCPTVVACREAPRGWLAVWRHQLRWARTIRHCQPLPYAFSLLSNATLWPLLWLAVAQSPAAWLGFGLCLACRLAMAAHCQWRLTRSWRHLPWLWLAPVKDLLQVALWFLAFAGGTVEWRGERYRVVRGGTLHRCDVQHAPCR